MERTKGKQSWPAVTSPSEDASVLIAFLDDLTLFSSVLIASLGDLTLFSSVLIASLGDLTLFSSVLIASQISCG